MRTSQEIYHRISRDPSKEAVIKATLEVLLDIRQLLIDEKESKYANTGFR